RPLRSCSAFTSSRFEPEEPGDRVRVCLYRRGLGLGLLALLARALDAQWLALHAAAEQLRKRAPPRVRELEQRREQLLLVPPAVLLSPGGGVRREPAHEREQPADPHGLAQVEPVVALKIGLDGLPAVG